MPPASSRDRPGAALTIAYLGSVGLLTIAHFLGDWPTVNAVALTPDLFAQGKIWLLATSAFLVDSDSLSGAWLPFLALALSVLLLGSSRWFVRAAIVGHVGSTILTYAGIGVLLLVDPGAVRALLHEPDYGISCVWAGLLGAAATHAWNDHDGVGRVAIPLAALAALGLMTGTSGGLARPEHIIAFCLGCLTIVAMRRRAMREGTLVHVG